MDIQNFSFDPGFLNQTAVIYDSVCKNYNGISKKSKFLYVGPDKKVYKRDMKYGQFKKGSILLSRRGKHDIRIDVTCKAWSTCLCARCFKSKI